MPTYLTIRDEAYILGAWRKEQLSIAGKVRGGFTEVGSEMSRVSAELGVGMRSFHWREQHEHRSVSAGLTNICPGAELRVAGSANLPAPTPDPATLYVWARLRDQENRAGLCVQRRGRVCKDREHTLNIIWLLLTLTRFKNHLD